MQNSLEDIFALLRFLRCGPYGVDASTAAQPSTTSTDLPETAPPSKKAHSLYTAEFVKGRGGGGGDGGESFLRVHWVAVPEAMRARRVNRHSGARVLGTLLPLSAQVRRVPPPPDQRSL